MLADELRGWLISNYGLSEGLTDDTPIFSSGMLDSFNMIELVSQFEKLAGKKVRALDVSPENFDTIGRMAALASRLGAK